MDNPITLIQLHKELEDLRDDFNKLREKQTIDHHAIYMLETRMANIDAKLNQIDQRMTNIDVNVVSIAQDTTALKITIAKIVGGLTAIGVALSNIKPILAIFGLFL